MERKHVSCLTVHLFLICCFVNLQRCLAGPTTDTGGNIIFITSGVPLTVTVPTNTQHQVELDSIGPTTHHIVFQVHSWYYPVNVSLTAGWVVGSSTHGHDVGVVTLVKPGITSAIWWVNTTGEADNATLLIVAHPYTYYDPIPGGCNTELPLENDPNLYVSYSDAQNKAQFAYADKGTQGILPSTCENAQLQDDFHYEFYYKYLDPGDLSEDTYLTTILGLLTALQIESNGTQLLTLQYLKSKSSVQSAAYRKHGVAYALVVRDSSSDSVAAYVPAISYGCSMDESSHNYCYKKRDWTLAVLTCIAGLAGLFVCFFGHRFLKAEMFFFGFWAFTLVVYIILSRFTDWAFGVVLAVAGVAGCAGGALWLCVWILAEVPIISVLLPGLVMGYVVTAVIFGYTPVGNYSIFKSSFNYFMTYACGVLILPVILLPFPKKLSIFSSALVGALFVVLAADSFLDVTFSYFLGNSLNKATIPSFINAYIIMPVQTLDVMLIVMWLVLVVGGVICQYCLTKKSPDFSFSSNQRRRMRNEQQLNHPAVNSGEEEYVDEQSPLLFHARIPGRRHPVPTAPIEPPLVGDL